jgi:hypothetical protein
LLDAIVEGIGDIDAVAEDGDAARAIEATLCRARAAPAALMDVARRLRENRRLRAQERRQKRQTAGKNHAPGEHPVDHETSSSRLRRYHVPVWVC